MSETTNNINIEANVLTDAALSNLLDRVSKPAPLGQHQRESEAKTYFIIDISRRLDQCSYNSKSDINLKNLADDVRKYVSEL